MTTIPTTFPPARSGATARRLLADYGLLMALVALIALFTALNPRFLTVPNLTTMLEQNAPLMIVAAGMTFAIISRNIDLAPASIIALSGVFIGLTFQATGSVVLAVAAGLAGALAVELMNAVLIVRGGLNPLIVTLAAWIWARGLAVSLTGANSILVRDPFISWISSEGLGGIGPAVILAALVFLACGFILGRTRLGRYTYAMGSDERATIQAGVPTGKYKLLMFGLFGVCAWLATLVTVSRLGAAAPDAAYGLELDAIVAVIIGGNPFTGGEGNVRRTLIGVLFISVLNNGFGNLGILDAQIAVYKGTAIILALLLGAVSVKLARR